MHEHCGNMVGMHTEVKGQLEGILGFELAKPDLLTGALKT